MSSQTQGPLSTVWAKTSLLCWAGPDKLRLFLWKPARVFGEMKLQSFSFKALGVTQNVDTRAGGLVLRVCHEGDSTLDCWRPFILGRNMRRTNRLQTIKTEYKQSNWNKIKHEGEETQLNQLSSESLAAGALPDATSKHKQTGTWRQGAWWWILRSELLWRTLLGAWQRRHRHLKVNCCFSLTCNKRGQMIENQCAKVLQKTNKSNKNVT